MKNSHDLPKEAPPPEVSDSQPNLPSVHVSMFSLAQLARPAPYQSVEDAYPVEKRVVEALVSVVRPATESVPVAVMFEPMMFSFAKMFPATESLANGEVVPMPTLRLLAVMVMELVPLV